MPRPTPTALWTGKNRSFASLMSLKCGITDGSQNSVRRAANRDVPTVVHFLVLMLEGMSSMGGNKLSGEEPSRLEERARDVVQRGRYAFIIADLVGTEGASAGLVEAQILVRESVFEPQRVLHINAVYVLRPHRRRGIGGTFLRAGCGLGPGNGLHAGRAEYPQGEPGPFGLRGGRVSSVRDGDDTRSVVVGSAGSRGTADKQFAHLGERVGRCAGTLS